MEEIKITTEYITLGQFLKLAGVVESGALAKQVINDGYVFVNGIEELRRGRKLYHDDVVVFDDLEFKVIHEGS